MSRQSKEHEKRKQKNMTKHSYFHVIQKLNEMLLNNACLLKQTKKYLTRFFLTQIFRVYLYYSSVARILEV